MARVAPLVLTLLAGLSVADAATIVQRRVDLSLDGSGMLERHHLVVRLDESGDLEAWSEYGFGLDDHIELVDIDARVLGPDGDVIDRVPRRKLREITSTGFGLYSSARTMVVPFPKLNIGERLDIDITRRHRLLFPTYAVILQLDTAQDRLDVEVKAPQLPLRYVLQAAEGLMDVEPTDQGLAIHATDVPRYVEPSLAGDAFAVRPVLRLAWDDTPSWTELGTWYSDLAAGIRRNDPEIVRVATEVTAGIDDPHDRLVALGRWVQDRIRYEAVEIGDGGWVPTPAHEVLSRGWGDCKDMSELLAEMLHAVGIPAHLTLAHTGRGARVDPNFPTTLQFNHCIVAVPAEAVGERQDDVVVGGFVLLDPTIDRGSPTWLPGTLHDQWVLVADGADSQLVRIPVDVGEQQRVLALSGRIGIDGGFDGTASMILVGDRAMSWLADIGAVEPARLEERIDVTLQLVLNGARIDHPTWKEIEGNVPSVQIDADIHIPRLVTGSGDRRRTRLAMLTGLPGSRVLDDRTEPVVLRPGIHRTVWTLTLPAGWCPPEVESVKYGNATGSVTSTIEVGDDGVVHVDRRVAVLRPWYGNESFDQLRELCGQENRMSKRSLRLRCDDPEPAASPAPSDDPDE